VPPSTRRPPRATVAAGLAAVAVLLLTALAALAARGGRYTAELPSSGAPRAAQPARPVPLPSLPSAAAPATAADPGPGSPVVGTVLLVLLLLLAAAALVLLGWLLWQHRPERRLREARLQVAAADPTAIPEAVAQALRAVEQPDAREAVVSAWLLLGAAAAAAGTPARPAETATEYGDRLAAAHGLPTAAVHRLAGLYREARFSGHPVRPEQRDAARAELTALQAALR